jgi:hypothetical protein
MQFNDDAIRFVGVLLRLACLLFIIGFAKIVCDGVNFVFGINQEFIGLIYYKKTIILFRRRRFNRDITLFDGVNKRICFRVVNYVFPQGAEIVAETRGLAKAVVVAVYARRQLALVFHLVFL